MLYVAGLYHFMPIDDVAGLRSRLLEIAKRNDIRGTLILATEGMNGTVCGSSAALDELLEVCVQLGCPVPRRDPVETNPFRRIFVHAKSEIVTMGIPDIDPNQDRGTYVDPEEWNHLIEKNNILLVDTRNDFEFRLGTFSGAENPVTISFKEFPEWVRNNQSRLNNADGVAMFCTGGIRCEKATSYLKTLGIEQTYHLKGGILRYLDVTPPAESKFEGDCFVFDERIAVGHGLAINDDISMCYGCRHPVDSAMRADDRYEEGVSCSGCFDDTSDDQKAKFRMRSAQFKAAHG
jgi:UPF0176 protein